VSHHGGLQFRSTVTRNRNTIDVCMVASLGGHGTLKDQQVALVGLRRMLLQFFHQLRPFGHVGLGPSTISHMRDGEQQHMPGMDGSFGQSCIPFIVNAGNQVGLLARW
jgi:hypothetical protein